MLSQCLMKGKREGEQLAIVRYVELVPLLNAVHEARRRVCLQYTTAGLFGEKTRFRDECRKLRDCGGQ